jgi:hypothetical protein
MLNIQAHKKRLAYRPVPLICDKRIFSPFYHNLILLQEYWMQEMAKHATSFG